MNKYLFVLLIVIIGCNTNTSIDEKVENKLLGNWQFLDTRGNYIEALFEDSTYFIYNMSMGHSPKWKYFLRNDSLYTNIDQRRPGIHKTADINWIDDDKVVIVTQFSTDTMDRIKDAVITLENTDIKSDSAVYREAFNQRHENYLLEKGILTPEEVKDFKEKKIVPEDILKK